MKRRAFLKTTMAAAGLAGAAPVLANAAEKSATMDHEYYEIRAYTLKSPEKQALLDGYLRDGVIPAFNRLGVKAVGVLLEQTPSAKPVVYVVLPYPSLSLFAKAATQLPADALQKAGADYQGAPATDPVYERVESWLTQSFSGMPRLAMPAKGNQVYQLRIYESHNEKAGQKKIEMFNTGEIEIFKRVGLTPVFFGETIIGPRMPNLTYLLSFADKAAQDKGWNTFRGDAEWTKLKNTPGFTDKEIVSKITNLVLKPAEYSQF